jgi:hypothetical protein
MVTQSRGITFKGEPLSDLYWPLKAHFKFVEILITFISNSTMKPT